MLFVNHQFFIVDILVNSLVLSQRLSIEIYGAFVYNSLMTSFKAYMHTSIVTSAVLILPFVFKGSVKRFFVATVTAKKVIASSKRGLPK